MTEPKVPSNPCTTFEAAELLKVHPSTIRRMVQKKKLNGVKWHTDYIVDKDDVNRLVEEGFKPWKRV